MEVAQEGEGHQELQGDQRAQQEHADTRVPALPDSCHEDRSSLKKITPGAVRIRRPYGRRSAACRRKAGKQTKLVLFIITYFSHPHKEINLHLPLAAREPRTAKRKRAGGHGPPALLNIRLFPHSGMVHSRTPEK